MLLGEVNYKMGLKHRLAIPKRFRDVLGDDLIISRGYEGCLIIVNQAMWQQLTAPIQQASFLDQSARASARFLMGGAQQLQLDTQGRCIIPASLHQHADFQDEVVFVGLERWLEVWSLARWQEQLELLETQSSSMAQQLSGQLASSE